MLEKHRPRRQPTYFLANALSVTYLPASGNGPLSAHFNAAGANPVFRHFSPSKTRGRRTKVLENSGRSKLQQPPRFRKPKDHRRSKQHPRNRHRTTCPGLPTYAVSAYATPRGCSGARRLYTPHQHIYSQGAPLGFLLTLRWPHLHRCLQLFTLNCSFAYRGTTH